MSAGCLRCGRPKTDHPAAAYCVHFVEAAEWRTSLAVWLLSKLGGRR
jgi:hypothetical protein